jgi:hypothetical protein
MGLEQRYSSCKCSGLGRELLLLLLLGCELLQRLRLGLEHQLLKLQSRQLLGRELLWDCICL